MTVLVVVFVEVLPKTLAIIRADDVARGLSRPMLVVVRLLGPVIFAIQWVVRRTLRLFGVDLDMATDVLAAHEEIRGAVEYHHSEGLVESGDRRMLGGVLDLSDMDVAEIMVHRRQVAMIDADLPARELVAKALEFRALAPAALARRAGQHRRRAARQGPAAGAGGDRAAGPNGSTSPPSPASRGSSPKPPSSRTSSTPS